MKRYYIGYVPLHTFLVIQIIRLFVTAFTNYDKLASLPHRAGTSLRLDQRSWTTNGSTGKEFHVEIWISESGQLQ